MQTDVISSDFSIAFDKVNYKVLRVLHKLSHMGFSVPAVECLNSYLLQRTQQVKFRNVISKSIKVQSGSQLGPMLLTLLFNELPSVVLRSKVLMYPSDVKIFNTLNNVNRFDLLRADFCCFYSYK